MLSNKQIRILKGIAAGTTLALAGLTYAKYKYAARPDGFGNFTNTMLGVEGIEELSTYVEETTGQRDLSTDHETTHPDDASVSSEGMPIYPGPYNLDFIRNNCTLFAFPATVDAGSIEDINNECKPLVGIRETDGNIKNSTSIYIQDKTRVTNHRRVMYRQRNTFTKALVAQVKLSIDWKTRDPANEKVARKMIKDAMSEHGLSITDSVRTLPIAIEAVFLPNDAEIFANDWKHSRAAADRINRYYKSEDNGNLSTIRWIWNNCFDRETEQSGGRLNTMDEPFNTPSCLQPTATTSTGRVERPPHVD